MRVDVVVFGVLKEHLGTSQTAVELEQGSDVAALLTQIRERSVSDRPVWATLAVAVNREYAGLSTVLYDGDEVALLPPVSGGHHAG